MKRIVLVLIALATCLDAVAQSYSVKLAVSDASNQEAVSFATVSITPSGAKKAAKYVLTDDSGKASISGVRSGSYTLKVELLGYKELLKEISVKGDVDLGMLKMTPDRRQLDAAKVSAVGNPIIIKKDTIEYNASSFKTTDNDVLEDLLKKLPGVDVSEDGSITVNGETIKKITIDGKTFFLDDPQLASKNLPAKMIEKLKVVEKKSDQAEFTGIDDGERETVIDLSIKPGMMKGTFGNIMAGGGHDLPSDGTSGDWRYQGAGFGGKFTKHQQLSVILNGNNTNNRGFNDMSASMMGNMRGGGGGRGRGQGGWGSGNGITTSYMAGVNGAWDLLDNRMQLGGNYLFNSSDKSVQEQASKTVYQKDAEHLVYKTGGIGGGPAFSNSFSNGHRFGVRLEHKFSEKTSILFQPQVNFGRGSYVENSADTTFLGRVGGDKVNTATTRNFGDNRNVSTDGFLLFRQRLGIPGRTISAMVRYSFSNNELKGENHTGTEYFDGTASEKVDQNFRSHQKSGSVNARLTYTEPLGNHFYIEGSYRFQWSRSNSEKNTFNMDGSQDYAFSNNIINNSRTHTASVNAMFQSDKVKAQAGLSVMPNVTTNETTRFDKTTGSFSPMTYSPGVRWNWAPQAMVWAEPNDNFNFRLFYRGNTNQPSTSRLMPVEDNTDPLNRSFGNPSLVPYFTHSLNSDIRFNNKRTFFSFNIRLNGEYVKDPVVNTTWSSKGAQYSMPFNCEKPSFNAGMHGFINIPIAKSNFSVNNMLRLNYSSASSYVGKDIDMSSYTSEDGGFYKFMNEFIANFNDPAYFNAHLTLNNTRTFSVVERLRATYRIDALELQVQGRTRFNKSWYDIATMADRTTTFNNQVRFSVNWTWDAPGITVKSDFNYNWYNGYSFEQPSEYVLNAEIQKLLFKKKLTLALKGYDIFGQARNLTVKDETNYHSEVINNTLGRYIILSATFRFGTFDRSKMRGGPMGGGRRF